MTARIRSLSADEAGRRVDELSALLIDSVEGGASVGFLLPMTRAKADAFWAGVTTNVASGGRILLVAEAKDGRILGTAQLVFAGRGSDARRRGRGPSRGPDDAGARHRDGGGGAGL